MAPKPVKQGQRGSASAATAGASRAMP